MARRGPAAEWRYFRDPVGAAYLRQWAQLLPRRPEPGAGLLGGPVPPTVRGRRGPGHREIRGSLERGRAERGALIHAPAGSACPSVRLSASGSLVVRGVELRGPAVLRQTALQAGAKVRAS